MTLLINRQICPLHVCKNGFDADCGVVPLLPVLAADI